MQNIHIVDRADINIKKWNTLVNKFANGLPYANSWYLDSVCENWKIIIYKDYKAGFAFQIKRKFGISYSLHPFLVQQLGFFGNDNTIFRHFLLKIKGSVFFYQYQLNYFNSTKKNIIQTNTNYELLLNQTYQDLYKQYKTNTKRNIRKAKNNRISIDIEYTLEANDIKFIQEHSKISLEKERLIQFNNLIINAEKNNSLEIYKARQNKTLKSIVIFIKNKTRAIYLMAVSNTEGQVLKTNFLLIDTFIKNNSENNIILDFEGSNISGIARFYIGFGAYKTTYSVIKETSFKNFFIKIFKRI